MFAPLKGVLPPWGGAAATVSAPPAFRQQLLAAIPRLRRYARSLVYDAQNADDLVQNALERALGHWRQFDPRRDIVLWLPHLLTR